MARRPHVEASSKATKQAALAAHRAERLRRDNAALHALAAQSLEESATSADDVAVRAERLGLARSAESARAHAARARQAASLRRIR